MVFPPIEPPATPWHLDDAQPDPGDDLVAAYLVLDDTGVLVVDAGLSGHWRPLLRELAGL